MHTKQYIWLLLSFPFFIACWRDWHGTTIRKDSKATSYYCKCYYCFRHACFDFICLDLYIKTIRVIGEGCPKSSLACVDKKLTHVSLNKCSLFLLSLMCLILAYLSAFVTFYWSEFRNYNQLFVEYLIYLAQWCLSVITDNILKIKILFWIHIFFSVSFSFISLLAWYLLFFFEGS